MDFFETFYFSWKQLLHEKNYFYFYNYFDLNIKIVIILL